MDLSFAYVALQESLYIILVFLGFLVLAAWKGRYLLINLIFALFLALLFTLEFPYLSVWLTNTTPQVAVLAEISLFVIFTIISLFLFRRHIPGDDYEKTFESFWKKILLAVAATGLVMAFGYNVLSVTELIDPGTPIQNFFAADAYFFWWILAPVIILFIV